MMGFPAMFGRVVRRCLSASCAKFNLTDGIKLATAVPKPLPLPLLTQVGTISNKRVRYPVKVKDPSTPEELAQFAQDFKLWRIQHKFSQKEVGKQLGINQSMFEKFEIANIQVASMQRIAKLIIQWWSENEVLVSHSATRLADSQVAVLEESFAAEPYPSVGEKKALARKLELPEGRIATWFQNKRNRTKQTRHCTGDMREFAIKFRTTRSRLGISQKAIAEATGRYSFQQISMFERMELTPVAMQSMQGTLQKAIEIAEEAELTSSKSAKQARSRSISCLSKDKKERLAKLVEENFNMKKTTLAAAIAEEMDLPVKTLTNFIKSKRRNMVKNILDKKDKQQKKT